MTAGALTRCAGLSNIDDYDLHGLTFGMETVLGLADRPHAKASWKRQGRSVQFDVSWSARNAAQGQIPSVLMR